MVPIGCPTLKMIFLWKVLISWKSIFSSGFYLTWYKSCTPGNSRIFMSSMVHGSALLVIFSSLSPQDLNSKFLLTLILFLPSIQPLLQSFSWKRIEAVTLVINNIQKRPTLPQVPIISVECTVLKHRSQLGCLLTCQKWDEMIVQCIQRKFRTNLEGD